MKTMTLTPTTDKEVESGFLKIRITPPSTSYAYTCREMEKLLRQALEHIECYDDGMAGWLDKAREVLT